jgi:hypothetical protein
MILRPVEVSSYFSQESKDVWARTFIECRVNWKASRLRTLLPKCDQLWPSSLTLAELGSGDLARDITAFLPSDLPLTVRASIDLGGGHTISSELPDIRFVQDGMIRMDRSLQREN